MWALVLLTDYREGLNHLVLDHLRFKYYCSVWLIGPDH